MNAKMKRRCLEEPRAVVNQCSKDHRGRELCGMKRIGNKMGERSIYEGEILSGTRQIERLSGTRAGAYR